MARYQGQVAVFRATVPLGVKTPEYKFEPQDRRRSSSPHKKWQELGIVPSELCSDEQFMRRVSLDLTGTLPTPTQVAGVPGRQGRRQARQADRSAARIAGIQLLLRQQVGRHPPRQAAATSRTGRSAPSRSTTGFARRSPPTSPTTSSSAKSSAPSATRPRTRRPCGTRICTTPEQFVDDTAQVFLGLRMACAQCHHHPYEKWSQDDYWGWPRSSAASAARTSPMPGAVARTSSKQRQVIFSQVERQRHQQAHRQAGRR